MYLEVALEMTGVTNAMGGFGLVGCDDEVTELQ